MDIDKEISSLERNGILSISESPKLLATKALIILFISFGLTYLIKPIYIVELKLDPMTKSCGYSILKKQFLIVSIINFILLYLISYYFNLL